MRTPIQVYRDIRTDPSLWSFAKQMGKIFLFWVIFMVEVSVLASFAFGTYDNFTGNPRGSGLEDSVVGDIWTEGLTAFYVSNRFMIAPTTARGEVATVLPNAPEELVCTQMNSSSDFVTAIAYYQYSDTRTIYTYWETSTKYSYFDGAGYVACESPMYIHDGEWLCFETVEPYSIFKGNDSDSMVELCQVSTTYDDGKATYEFGINTGASMAEYIVDEFCTADTFADCFNDTSDDEGETDYNISLWGSRVNRSNFQFSSDEFVTVFKGNMTMNRETNLTVFLSMNLEKMTGATSTAFGRFLVNDTVGNNYTLRTMTTGDIGSTGIMDSFVLEGGYNYNITFQIRREGNGIIAATNVDGTLIKAETTNNELVDYKFIFDNFSTYDNGGLQYNFSVDNRISTKNFITSINTINVTASSIVYSRFFNNFPVERSRFIHRNVGSSGSYGSYQMNTVQNGSGYLNNYSYQVFSTNFPITINFSLADIGLTDYINYSVHHDQLFNNASYDTPLMLNSGTNKVASKVVQIYNGSSIFISYTQSAFNNGTGTTATHIVNVTDYLGNVVCSFTKDRVYSASDYGNVFMYGTCDSFGDYTVDNLTVQSYIITSSSDLWIYEDEITILETKGFPLSPLADVTAPTIELYYPNETFWTNESINGTCYDTSVVINISVNDSDWTFSGTPNNWTFTYTGLESTANASLEINCTDIFNNVETFVYEYGVDVVLPYCATLQNATVVYNTSYLWAGNTSCYDDLNLYSINISCTGGSDFSHYGFGLNVTVWNVTNSTGDLLTDMVCEWTTKDAHTLINIIDKLDVGDDVKVFDNAITVNEIEMIEYNDIDRDLTGITLEQSLDRISYSFNFDTAKTTRQFYVRGEKDRF